MSVAALFSHSTAANTVIPLQLLADTDSIVVPQQHLSLYEDPNDTQTINDIAEHWQTDFKPITTDQVSVTNTTNSVWAHFQVIDRTTDSSERTWLLDIDYSMLKRAEIYLVQSGSVVNHYSIGYENPMTSREFSYRFFAQPIVLQANTTYDIFINAKRERGAIKIPLRLTTPLAFAGQEITKNYVYGVTFGVLLAMMIYNLFIYLSVGERVYLYYISYIGFTGIALLALTGYGYFFIWPKHPIINEYIISLSALAACVSSCLFTRHLIRREYYSPLIDHVISGFVAVGIGLIVWKLVSGRYLGVELALYVGLLSVTAPVFLTYCWKKGSRSAGFFLLSWTAFLIGNGIYELTLHNILASNIITDNGLLIGCATEMLLLSLALADRINRAKKSEYSALQEQHRAAMELQRAEDRLLHRAMHSGMTGLPNRSHLKSIINDVLKTQSAPQFAMMVVTINNFHEISKTLGNANAIAILNAFIERFKPLCIDIPDSMVLERTESGPIAVASVETATFSVLINQLDQDKLLDAGKALLLELEEPLDYQGLSLILEVSAGMALCPSHGQTSEDLLRSAHIALDSAEQTSEKIAIYSPDIDPYNERRILLIGELKNAIEKDELELYYQPQISLEDFKVTGVEVLIRWSHPTFGFIPPDEFIPLAERTGTIQPLTMWIVNKAFAFKQQLETSGHSINVSINMSARNLQDRNFKDQICSLAQRHNVKLEEVVMELTETAIMRDTESALQVMNELSAAGVSLSVDDFGTGHASLSYIRKLPVDEIKIDRSFVMEMISNHDDQVIVNTTLLMGHNLNLKVVAEGIEDETTLLKLKEMGCDLAQGYHIARPMPAAQLAEWLDNYQIGQDEVKRAGWGGE